MIFLIGGGCHALKRIEFVGLVEKLLQSEARKRQDSFIFFLELHHES